MPVDCDSTSGDYVTPNGRFVATECSRGGSEAGHCFYRILGQLINPEASSAQQIKDGRDFAAAGVEEFYHGYLETPINVFIDEPLLGLGGAAALAKQIRSVPSTKACGVADYGGNHSSELYGLARKMEKVLWIILSDAKPAPLAVRFDPHGGPPQVFDLRDRNCDCRKEDIVLIREGEHFLLGVFCGPGKCPYSCVCVRCLRRDHRDHRTSDLSLQAMASEPRGRHRNRFK